MVGWTTKDTIPTTTRPEHQKLVRRLQGTMQEFKRTNQPVTQSSSNHSFGLRRMQGSAKLDLSVLNGLIRLDDNGVVELEGSCTIEHVLQYLQQRGRTLPVIPDMKHLRMGGIVSGIGGGSGSWREGAFHDAVVGCDVLLASGDLLQNIGPSDPEHASLFHAIPGSLGTLGYITRLRMRTLPLYPYVVTRNIRCGSLQAFLKLVETHGASADFVDGTAFSPTHIVCVLGYKTKAVHRKPNNFVNHRIYWKALKDIANECYHVLPLMEYIYRWETDLYYTSANPDLPDIARAEWIRPWIPRSCIPIIKRCIAAVHPVDIDNVCADVMIPMHKAQKFWKFYTETVGLYPVYLCPTRSRNPRGATFWTGEPLLDFGLGYGVLPGSKQKQDAIRVQVEQCMLALGGRKLPYSFQSLSEKEFWDTRGGRANKDLYERLRREYQAEHLPSVYDKLKQP